jgi:hypothetical protein
MHNAPDAAPALNLIDETVVRAGTEIEVGVLHDDHCVRFGNCAVVGERDEGIGDEMLCPQGRFAHSPRTLNEVARKPREPGDLDGAVRVKQLKKVRPVATIPVNTSGYEALMASCLAVESARQHPYALVAKHGERVMTAAQSRSLPVHRVRVAARGIRIRCLRPLPLGRPGSPTIKL